MAVAQTKVGGDDWGVLFAAGAVGGLDDAELLDRFARGRGDAAAEAAFAALVDRHGPMVLGVCRRVTGDRHAAEDAFQATFLVLARRAGGLRLTAEDSLGRWLYGVSLRVARRARSSANRPMASTGLDGVDSADSSSFHDPREHAELRAAIDAEIARLPSRYRSAVVLCWLEGLSQEQAARRLRCPVGTLQSRLHRARGRLRSGLTRRGLAPATAVLASLERTTRAAMPPALTAATIEIAVRVSAGESLAGSVPMHITGLAATMLRTMTMKRCGMSAGVIVLGLAMVGGAVGLVAAGDAPQQAETKPAAKAGDGRKEPPSAKVDRLITEYEAAERVFLSFFRGSTIPKEDEEKALKLQPDFAGVVRRITDAVDPAPADPVARDAMLWVIEQGQRGGLFTNEFVTARTRLLRYFGDDPDAVRVGLTLDNAPDAERDVLLLGFYATSKGREAKGLARLALAQYLDRKAVMADGARNVAGRPVYTHDDLIRADGSLYSETEVMPDDSYAYLLHLKQCDPAYLRAESERLYEEVIRDYADVPYITPRQRRLEALLKRPEPRWKGERLTDEARRKIAAGLARPRKALGEVAEARLDERRNLAVGCTAPEIVGVVADGKPMKLSDHRGKVVALVFWAGSCGPCMREIPREKALLERMKGRPFALLGVNLDEDTEGARRVVKDRGMTWPVWLDGAAGEGPIARLYHIQGYPTYVLDAEGKIRSKMARGEALDRLVEGLVSEREAARK